MEPITVTLDHVWYVIVTMGVVSAFIMWFVETLNNDIYRYVWEIVNENRKLILELGVTKTLLGEKSEKAE
jgi:hypothetical protein